MSLSLGQLLRPRLLRILLVLPGVVGVGAFGALCAHTVEMAAWCATISAMVTEEAALDCEPALAARAGALGESVRGRARAKYDASRLPRCAGMRR